MPRRARRRVDPKLFGNMHGQIVAGRLNTDPVGSPQRVLRAHHYDGAVKYKPVDHRRATEKLNELLRRRPSITGRVLGTAMEELPQSAEYALRRLVGGARAYPALLARGWTLADIAHLELSFIMHRDPRGLFESDRDYVKRLLTERDYNLKKWGFQV